MTGIPYSLEFKMEDLEPTMRALEYDEYIDLVESEKKGDFYYCITLLKKGFAFQRSEEQRLRARRSSIISKILLALLGGAITVILTRVLGPLIFK